MSFGWQDIREVLFPPVSPSAETEKARRAKSAKRIAALQARGNVSIQAGNVLSEDDINQLRDEVLQHSFP